jgi:putative ABC transport system permease protein
MLRDLKEALRSVLGNPGMAFVVVATLALAIGANTALFSVLNGVLLRPLPYPDPDELVVLWATNPSQNISQSQLSTGDYRDFRNRAESFGGMLAAYRHEGNTLTGVDRPERLESVLVSPVLFEALGVDAHLGRTFRPSEETPGNEKLVVLGHAFWTRRLGADPDIVESTISLDSEPYTVVGIMPEGFEFPAGEPEVELWLPLTLSEQAELDRAHRMYNAVGRLADGVTREQALGELDTLAAQMSVEFPQTNDGWQTTLVPAKEQLVGDISATLWVLFGAVTLVLLIGCVNVANVLVARSSEVAKDYVIRAALGAGRGELLRRSLAESLVLAAFGGLTGLLVALWGVSMLRAVIPGSVPRGNEIGLDVTVLGFSFALTIAAGLLFGILPALRVMRQDIVEVLKTGGGGRGSAGGRRARWLTDAMIVVEVALALVLLVAAGLMVRSFGELSRVDPGFRKEGVTSLMVSLPPSRYQGFENNRQFFLELIERVKATPGIGAAGAVTRLPMSSLGTSFEMPFTVQSLDIESPTERPRADFRGVIPAYLPAMGIPLIRGRLFDDADGQEGREVALVNQALVRRFFPDQDPIGKVLDMPMAGSAEIVGIVGNTRHDGLQSDLRPELYVPFRQLSLADMHVVVYSELEPARAAALVEEELIAMDAELAPTEITTIAALLSESIAQPRFNMALLVGLAVCAAALAAVGIYGVVSYSVMQRTSEIGVRMALGANASDTVAMIVTQALWVVGIGVALGVAGAIGAARFIEALLYGINGTDPVTYLVVGGLVIALGALAAAIPARRATAVDPVLALRKE